MIMITMGLSEGGRSPVLSLLLIQARLHCVPHRPTHGQVDSTAPVPSVPRIKYFLGSIGEHVFFHHYILHVYPVVYLSLFTKFSSRDPQPMRAPRATLVDGKQIEKVFSKPLEISQT